ncbi:hypothetical protein ACFQ2K_52955 [Streptomyces sanglieri]|uniref:Uncharacterized protein n=1 Tax=Streptomyces sanglieri TaxID=193460 RepID=A0ABW2WUK4_9ACTN
MTAGVPAGVPAARLSGGRASAALPSAALPPAAGPGKLCDAAAPRP